MYSSDARDLAGPKTGQWRQRFVDGRPVSRSAIERWIVAIAGSIVMLVIGTLYSWAIFTRPLARAFGWDLSTTTWAYAIANFSLATGGVTAGGFLLDRLGPRRVAMLGVGLWGIGHLIAGIGTARFGAYWLYVTYGLIAGFGAGMAYIVPLAVVSKWFPDRRGFASGLVVAGFGLGAFIYNTCIERLSGTREIMSGTSAAGVGSVMHLFVVSGLAFLAIGLPAAAMLKNPRAANVRGPYPIMSSPGYSPAQVLRMPQFYLLWLQLFASIIAGIAIISNAVVIASDLTGTSTKDIAPLIGGVSLFNAIGRFFWGALSDWLGCKNTFAAMLAVQALTLYLLGGVHAPAQILAGFAVVLLCCGGGFGTMPSYAAQCFGTRYLGLNYGLLLTAWGAAGLLGPMLAARARDLTGSFAGLLPEIACLLTAALILPVLTRTPSPAMHA